MGDTAAIVALAVVQGLTEFLPVSSSGHLVLAKSALAVQTPEGPLLEVVLHAGSMLSIAAYYRRRLIALAIGLWRREPAAWGLAVNLVIAAIPVLLVYPLLGDWIEAQFNRPVVAAAMLCVTGGLLLSVRWAPPGAAMPGRRHAFVMGLAQAVALLPGISRSGATLVAARWQGLAAKPAAELSFLMVLPLLAGATLLSLPKALDPAAGAGFTPGLLGLGLVVSAAVGYLALSLLVRVFASRRFHWFGVYCLAVGLGGLIWFCR